MLSLDALPQRLGTVPLDLAFGDGPRLAHEPSLELPLADLSAQRRRRHPQSGCRLSEREHLLSTFERDPLRMRGDVIGAAMDRDAGLETELADPSVADRAADVRAVGRVPFGDGGDEVFDPFGLRHLVPLRAAVDIRKIRAIAYVVNRVNA